MRSRCSRVKPGPESRMLQTTWPGSAMTWTRTVPWGPERRTAFDSRLSATTATATRSAHASGTGPTAVQVIWTCVPARPLPVILTGAFQQHRQVDAIELQRKVARRRHRHQPADRVLHEIGGAADPFEPDRDVGVVEIAQRQLQHLDRRRGDRDVVGQRVREQADERGIEGLDQVNLQQRAIQLGFRLGDRRAGACSGVHAGLPLRPRNAGAVWFSYEHPN